MRERERHERNSEEDFQGRGAPWSHFFRERRLSTPAKHARIYIPEEGGGTSEGDEGGEGIGKTAKPRDVTLNLSAAYPHTRRYPSILLYPRDAVLRMTAPPADLSHKT